MLDELTRGVGERKVGERLEVFARCTRPDQGYWRISEQRHAEMARFCTLVWPLLRQSHAKNTIFRPTECCVAYRRFHHGIGNIILSLSYRDALGSALGVPLELSCYLAALIAFRPPESFLCPDIGQHPLRVRHMRGHFVPPGLKIPVLYSDNFGMNPRGKIGKVATLAKASKAAESFNFFQGCSTSVHPDWAAGVSKFKLIRRRNARARD